MDRPVTPDPETSNPSWRKPVGALAIMAIIAAWAVVVAGAAPVVGTWHWALQAIFYLVAGIAWIFPVRPMLGWMETGRFR